MRAARSSSAVSTASTRSMQTQRATCDARLRQDEQEGCAGTPASAGRGAGSRRAVADHGHVRAAAAVRLGPQLPRSARLEDVRFDNGAANAVPRPLVALVRPDPAEDVRALGAVAECVAALMNFEEASRDVRPE